MPGCASGQQCERGLIPPVSGHVPDTVHVGVQEGGALSEQHVVETVPVTNQFSGQLGNGSAVPTQLDHGPPSRPEGYSAMHGRGAIRVSNWSTTAARTLR